MNPELDKSLVKAFPNLYADRYADMRQTAMCWGFECGDGWYDLIYDLSAKLEAIIVAWKEENPDEEWVPRASQVKEKYGGLRFYMTSGSDEIWDLTDEAEAASLEICEHCGAVGEMMIKNGWFKTLCADCGDLLGYILCNCEDCEDSEG